MKWAKMKNKTENIIRHKCGVEDTPSSSDPRGPSWLWVQEFEGCSENESSPIFIWICEAQSSTQTTHLYLSKKHFPWLFPFFILEKNSWWEIKSAAYSEAMKHYLVTQGPYRSTWDNACHCPLSAYWTPQLSTLPLPNDKSFISNASDA